MKSKMRFGQKPRDISPVNEESLKKLKSGGKLLYSLVLNLAFVVIIRKRQKIRRLRKSKLRLD